VTYRLLSRSTATALRISVRAAPPAPFPRPAVHADTAINGASHREWAGFRMPQQRWSASSAIEFQIEPDSSLTQRPRRPSLSFCPRIPPQRAMILHAQPLVWLGPGCSRSTLSISERSFQGAPANHFGRECVG
jgi:hypothetical protein